MDLRSCSAKVSFLTQKVLIKIFSLETTLSIVPNFIFRPFVNMNCRSRNFGYWWLLDKSEEDLLLLQLAYTWGIFVLEDHYENRPSLLKTLEIEILYLLLFFAFFSFFNTGVGIFKIHAFLMSLKPIYWFVYTLDSCCGQSRQARQMSSFLKRK